MPHEAHADVGDGIRICYDSFGDPEDPTVLMIMGLGGPMTWWPAEMCQLLADRGFHVVRFDNRDVGRSSRMREIRARRSMVIRSYVRRSAAVGYTVSDMARDAVGLLDHLGVRKAHVTGVSMGGFIAQTLAIEHPQRVLSLVSIMSSTGRRSVGWQHPSLFPLLLRRDRADRERYVAASDRIWRMIGSPQYPTPVEETRARAGETFDRGISASGVVRQMTAVLAQPDRTVDLSRLDLPTLVIHGLSDKMVHVSGGRATASAIPGAELLLIPGMGHDLPRQLWPVFLDGIERTASRVATSDDRALGWRAP
jgi:pimeloyl-ACP methyl ester carboxylesterase